MAATKGLMDHLVMAVCEWFLMFLMFINAALAYFLRKFAQYCELEVPCLFCLRLDHLFGNEEPGSYVNLFCNKHQADISYLMCCNLHNKLANVREMCEDCFMSITTPSQSNSESYRFVVGAMGREREGHRRSYLNKNFVCVPSSTRTCSCCKRQWKAKPSGQRLIKPNAMGSRVSKVATRPPLPCVPRRGRSSRRDSLKRTRDKIKHHSVDALSSIGYSELKIISDTESEFPFSDEDNASFRLLGVGERMGSKDDLAVLHSARSQKRVKTLGRHSHSVSDLRSAFLLEMHLDESHSPSLTPNCSIGLGLGKLKLSRLQTRPNSSSSPEPSSLNTVQFSLRKSKESGSLKVEKDKGPVPSTNSIKGMDSSANARSYLSNASLDKTNGHGSFNDYCVPRSKGSHNRYKILARHSYSASDLGSALLLEMHLDKNFTRRSASVTPNCSFGHGLGELNCLKFQTRHGPSHSTELDSVNAFQSPLQKGKESVPLKAKKDKKPLPSVNSIKGLGLSTTSLDKSHRHGSLDDSVVSCSTGNQNQYKIPARHSYSASDLGSALLLEMYLDGSLTSSPTSLTPNCSIGHGLGEINWSKFQARPSPSHSPEPSSLNALQSALRKAKKDKKPSPSRNFIKRMDPSTNARNELSSASFDKIVGHGYLADSIISRNMGNQNRYNTLTRHSYSASDLGSALLLEMCLDESFTSRSASLTPNCSIAHGLEELKWSKFQTRPSPSRSQKLKLLNPIQFPFQTAEESQTLKPKKDKKSLSSTNAIQGLGSSTNTRSDLSNASLDKTDGHLSLDDSVVSSSTGGQNRSEIFSRHSYSVSDLGSALFLEMHPDDRKRKRSASLTPNCLFGHGLEELNGPKFQTRPSLYSREFGSLNTVQCHLPKARKCDPLNAEKDKPLPSTYSTTGVGSLADARSDLSSSSLHKTDGRGSLDDSIVSHGTGSQNRYKTLRRHSYSASDLGSALLLQMHLDKILRRRSASVTPNCSIRHGLGERNWRNFQTRHSHSHSQELGSHNAMHCPLPKARKNDPLKAEKDEKPLASTNSIERMGSSSNVRSDLSTASLDKTEGHESLDDSVVSCSTGGWNRYKILARHSYSASDLGSAFLLEMHLDEKVTKRSTSLTPNCSTGHGLGEWNRPESQTKPSPSCSSEFTCLNVVHCPLPKAKKSDALRDKKDKNPLPSTNSIKGLGSSTNVRSDLSTTSFDKTDGHGSVDDSVVSSSMSGPNHYKTLARNSYSASDLGSAFLLEMHFDENLRRRSASLTPNYSIGNDIEESDWPMFQTQPSRSHLSEFDSFNVVQCLLPKAKTSDTLKAKKDKEPLPSTNSMEGLGSSTDVRSDLSATYLDKTDRHGSFDDSIVSRSTSNRNRYNILDRHAYSASDLGCALLLEMHLDESLRRRSASLTPDCLIGQGLGELDLSKFQNKGSSRSPEHSSLNAMHCPIPKAKKSDPSKVKKDTKSSSSTTCTRGLGSSTTSLDKTDRHGSLDDDSVVSHGMGSQNQYKVLARHSFSASDLASALLLEMHLDESKRRRSASLTPNCSSRHGLGELNWSEVQTRPCPSHSSKFSPLDATQFSSKNPKENDLQKANKDKPSPSTNPTKEINPSTNIKCDQSTTSLDKTDGHVSFDGSGVSDNEGEDVIEKLKQQVEHDRRCMSLLHSELEAERNAAAISANHAMTMITRLQQEKASLQMEALQYLRMMEEQVEYDMEALEKANELVDEKENEIQDLLAELELYRSKYGDEIMTKNDTVNVNASVKGLEDEKRYILQSLATIERKMHQFSSLQTSIGLSNADVYARTATNEIEPSEDLQSSHLKDENSLSTHKDSSVSNGFRDKSKEDANLVDSGKNVASKDGVTVDLATLQQEISGLNERMEALEAELGLLKHACNTLHVNGGREFVQEIAHQLQDLRRIMFEGRCISSN